MTKGIAPIAFCVFFGCGSFFSVGQDAVVLQSFDLSSGVFPKGTVTENLNGVLPMKDAYKHGYVETGWTIERLDNRGYVALSPTYNGEEKRCENRLSLPEWEISDGAMLCWEARSVYHHFPESYRIEAQIGEDSSPIVLFEVSAEKFVWTRHEVDLNKYAGKRVTINFLCTSDSGYMLALSSIGFTKREATRNFPETGSSMESSAAFTRNLFIDKGTGMWCTNCPDGELAIEAVKEEYGSRVVVVNTHTGDVLENPGYWGELKWYSVPRMMLNRIKATEGSNAKKFKDYYNIPTPFGIGLEKSPSSEAQKISANVSVMVSEELDNSDDRYRVGYVVTGNFHQPDDPRFRQRNNCTQPSAGAYYFLPSTIPSTLMYYDDVSLSHESAFTGIAGSLPEVLKPGQKHEVSLDVEVPELEVAPLDAELVAFVIDVATGEILNVASGERELSGVDPVSIQSAPLKLTVDSSGAVRSNLNPNEPFMLEVFDLSGMKLQCIEGEANGNDTFNVASSTGVMIVRLSSGRGCEVLKLR